ncbi:MAG TPA: hypothetical protein VM677_02210 [Actinokineospora sp.]|nr:hypothetical protein [Actinokineospora sp.]
MLLTEEQRLQLAVMVVDFLGGNRGSAAVALFGHDLVRVVPTQPNDFGFADWMLVQTLSRPSMEPFAHVLVTVDPGAALAEIHQLLQRVRRGEVEWDAREEDPAWMPPLSEKPFADRDRLRTAVREMAEGGGFPAITIEAPVGHGRTTMCHYIEHCAPKYGPFLPLVVSLQRKDTNEVVPFLARKVWRALGLPGEPTVPVGGTPDRRAQDFAVELARSAALSPRPVWLVADVVRSNLDEGVWTFLDELMGQVRADPLRAAKLKITIVADFSAVELPHKPEVDARFVLPDIGEAEIADWLAAVVPGKQEGLYQLSARMVMDKVTQLLPPAAMRLETIADHCLVARDQLRAMA